MSQQVFGPGHLTPSTAPLGGNLPHFAYAWHPFIEDYLRLGWMFAARPLIAEDRGGQPSWLVMWPCSCALAIPRPR